LLFETRLIPLSAPVNVTKAAVASFSPSSSSSLGEDDVPQVVREVDVVGPSGRGAGVFRGVHRETPWLTGYERRRAYRGSHASAICPAPPKPSASSARNRFLWVKRPRVKSRERGAQESRAGGTVPTLSKNTKRRALPLLLPSECLQG